MRNYILLWAVVCSVALVIIIQDFDAGIFFIILWSLFWFGIKNRTTQHYR